MGYITAYKKGIAIISDNLTEVEKLNQTADNQPMFDLASQWETINAWPFADPYFEVATTVIEQRPRFRPQYDSPPIQLRSKVRPGSVLEWNTHRDLLDEEEIMELSKYQWFKDGGNRNDPNY